MRLFSLRTPHSALRTPWRLLAAVASGLLFAFALTGSAASYAAFVALTPLLAALLWSPMPVWRAALFGWACGVLSTGLHFSYIVQAIHPAVFAGATAYIGIYTGLFAGGVAFCRSYGIERACLLAPCLWTALEFIRAHVMTGMPAGTLGVSQARNLPFIQIASVTGVFGISFVLVVVNVALTRLALLDRYPSRRPAVAWATGAGIMTLAVVGYGLETLQTPENGGASVYVATVQGDIDERGLDERAVRQRIFARYRERTEPLARRRPDLIVYPETMTGSYLTRDTLFLNFLSEMGERTGGAFVVGSRHLTGDGARYRLYNSVFLVDAAGRIQDRYDKARLAPFGEYTPLVRYFPWLARFRLARAELTPGNAARPVRTDAGPSIGVGVCYEAMFGDLMRRAVENGARLLVIVSDDFWFEGTDESRQLFEESILRAVENRIPVVRCANMGVSGVIDAYGRVARQPLEGVDGVIHGTARLRAATTFYTRYGDVWAWACLLVSVALLGWRGRRGNSAFGKVVTLSTPARWSL